jgi:hypothetical protein
MRKTPADFVRVISIFIITICALLPTAAQQSSNDNRKNTSAEENVSGTVQNDALDYKNEFAVWGGFAPDMPRVFGGSRPSSFGEIGLRYSRRIWTGENVALKYQVDFIPVAIIKYRRERLLQTTPTVIYNRDEETAYAVGLTPVNFQLNFRRKTKIQPFITAEAGMIFFNKDIPDDRSPLRPNQVGRRFNFTLAGGGGVEFLTDEARSYTVGFKFHHISNSSTGNINPGFDQNLFYFGYTFKKF